MQASYYRITSLCVADSISLSVSCVRAVLILFFKSLVDEFKQPFSDILIKKSIGIKLGNPGGYVS